MIGNGALDNTGPTVFKPQRFPWNPGGIGWGPLTGYKEVGFNGKTPWASDFHVWTLVFDVSGVSSVTLNVRESLTGTNPLSDNQNETYAGGSGVGAWQPIAMTRRTIPKGNVTGNSQLNFFQEPAQIADHYWAKITGYRNKLLDYYVQAIDGKGNVTRTDVQHVWVGDDGTSVSVPAAPVDLSGSATSSAQINLSWTASTGASSYRIFRDGAEIGTASSMAYSDSALQPATSYSYAIVAVNSAGSSDPSAALVVATQALSAPADFVMDGTADFSGYLVANSGMTIYAAVRGTKLYVATWTPGNNANGGNDHFIFVSDALLSTASATAPWAKSGTIGVASTKPFLAGESVGGYVGWFNAPAGSQATKASANGGQMEGSIDLVATFGAIPETIYIAAAAYGTADGGALAAQTPAGNGNGNIEFAEFAVLPVAALCDSKANGVFDRLDPARDFAVISVVPISGGGMTITWKAMPGRSYRVEYCTGPGRTWQPLGDDVTAGSAQQMLSTTDSVSPDVLQKFYRVKLLP
jgi:hypothetical protein